MQRVTVSLDEEIVAMIDEYMASHGATNRSEAVRDLVRTGAARARVDEADPAEPCVATLSYVFDHDRRDLGQRVTGAHHDHHDLTVATLHVHLGHSDCLEVSVLKGPVGEVRALADAVVNARGVRHGRLDVLPARVEVESHGHGGAPRPHRHVRI